MKYLVIFPLSICLVSTSFAVASEKNKISSELFSDAPLRPSIWDGLYVGGNAGGRLGDQQNMLVNLNGYTDNFNNQYQIPNGLFANYGSGFTNQSNSGFLGGIQIGYNYTVLQKVILGFEADIQATTGGSNGSFMNPSVTSVSQDYDSKFTSAGGGGNVNASMNWFGSVRGKIGDEIIPSLMVYGTGGLAYGGIKMSANNYMLPISVNDTNDGSLIDTISTIPGNGTLNKIQVGWTAGGGLEWMVSNGWSIKGEALYYNLGAAGFNLSPVTAIDACCYSSQKVAGAIALQNYTSAKTSFSGSIIRFGVNYHIYQDKIDSVFSNISQNM